MAMAFDSPIRLVSDSSVGIRPVQVHCANKHLNSRIVFGPKDLFGELRMLVLDACGHGESLAQDPGNPGPAVETQCPVGLD
jgi:hypothetical protein